MTKGNESVKYLKIPASLRSDRGGRHGSERVAGISGIGNRDMGWMKESLEEMKIAHAKAMIYGNTNEKEVVKSSLVNLKQEIENEDEDGSQDALLFFILLIAVIKKSSKATLLHLYKCRP